MFGENYKLTRYFDFNYTNRGIKWSPASNLVGLLNNDIIMSADMATFDDVMSRYSGTGYKFDNIYNNGQIIGVSLRSYGNIEDYVR